MKTRFTLRMQEERSIQLLIYRSFGTYKSVRIQGRALFHPGDLNAQDNDSIWRNLLNAYRRYESDEIPNLPLRVKIGENALDVVTDEEGYFDATIALRKPLSARIAWHKVQVFITDGPETGISAAGQVLITPANASLGIISDIDDTVLQTGAESLLTMARLTFLRNARTRLPFEGAAAFYNALHQGVDQREANPLFFVSSSPWNLYDFLIDFLEFHQFPKAPILLRDLGIDANKFIGATLPDAIIGFQCANADDFGTVAGSGERTIVGGRS
jgi:phosphatidate phosphatase APP1